MIGHIVSREYNPYSHATGGRSMKGFFLGLWALIAAAVFWFVVAHFVMKFW